MSELSAESENFQLLGVAEPPFTLESAREWIMDFLQRAEIHRFAVTRIDGLLTGVSELMVDDNTANIRMWIGSKYWNREYGGDAIQGMASLIFDRFLGVEEIICTTTQKNPALGQILETIGFRFDEPRKQFCLEKLTRAF